MKQSFSNKSTKTFFLFFFLLCCSTSFGWGVTGHRVVAEIAQNHLTKKARKELQELIGRQTLALWSNWPDFIKSDTTHTWDHTYKWHYINVPAGKSKEEFLQYIKNLPGENLYTQIQAMMEQLKDKKLSAEQRRTALFFLVHLVGDLHQPLHIGREEDLGGNRITVYWFDKRTNLHTVWDHDLVEFQQYSYTEYAHALDVLDKSQEASYQQSSLDNWFYESYELADKVYRLSQPGAKLSYRYNYIFKNDLDNQLLKGGLRLSFLLNNALN
jgi:hypothetical protein